MVVSKPPKFEFRQHPSTTPFGVPSHIYLRDHTERSFDHIATGALVFDDPGSGNPRVLLLQRSAHDSWPNCWEIPGGACDAEDSTILHGVARELWEESRLVASYIGPVIGDVQLFTSSSGRKIGKFVFAVQAKITGNGDVLKVKLDPNEHQNFVWANETEVKTTEQGGLKLEFTTPDAYNTILRAFELQKTGKLNFPSEIYTTEKDL